MIPNDENSRHYGDRGDERGGRDDGRPSGSRNQDVRQQPSHHVDREVASNTLAGANYADPATPRPVWSSMSDYFWACVSLKPITSLASYLRFSSAIVRCQGDDRYD